MTRASPCETLLDCLQAVICVCVRLKDQVNESTLRAVNIGNSGGTYKGSIPVFTARRRIEFPKTEKLDMSTHYIVT
jgi:hypothetical protein